MLGLETFNQADKFDIRQVCYVSKELRTFGADHIGSEHEAIGFELQLPLHVPSSLVAVSKKHKCEATVEYWLIAEYVPVDKANNVDVMFHPAKHDPKMEREGHHLHMSLSKFRAFRQINITIDSHLKIHVPAIVHVGHPVQDLLNIWTDPCIISLSVPKTDFAPGESVMMTVGIDNSQQGHPVKNVRVRLLRRIIEKNLKHEVINWEEMAHVYAVEWESKTACAAHHKETYHVNFVIPAHR